MYLSLVICQGSLLNYCTGQDNSMSENNPLKNKIKEWLDSEGYLVSEKDDSVNTDFHLVVSNFSSNAPYVDISKPKNKNILTIGTGIINPKESLDIFGSINEQERIRFFKGLQKELLKFKVDHNLLPNASLPQQMIISDLVQIDGITATSFMNSLKSVKFATLFLLWSIGQKFPLEKNQPSSPTTSNSRTPYG